MKNLMKQGRITFKILRYFYVLTKVWYFGNATNRLFISQPPWSVQIKELENILDFA